jgi:23S rRNA pseudouridine2605 synthase
VFIPRRLDKFLRDATALSVVDIREACLTGRVAVAPPSTPSPPATLPELLVFEDDRVTLDGHAVTPRTKHCYLVLNKPRFVTATAHDPDGRTDLGPWLQRMPLGTFPVGRLDRETSGALLFTNDGDFANAILQPGHHTSKLYWLWLDEHMPDDDPRLHAFVEGVRAAPDASPLRATSASVQHRTEDYTELHVTLDEGKNRHIRKMCSFLRLRLLQLHRKAIGTFQLGELPIGHFRSLHTSEVEQLWSSSGGTARVAQTKIAALTRFAEAVRDSHHPHIRLEAWLGQHVVAVKQSSS